MPRKRLVEKLKVVFEPDGKGWHVHVPSVRGCRSWGRSLSEARRHIREALSTCSDVFEDADRVAADVELVEQMHLPDDAKRELARYLKARKKMERHEQELRNATRTAAVALTKEIGISLRDAGELLGLSQERVRQIAN